MLSYATKDGTKTTSAIQHYNIEITQCMQMIPKPHCGNDTSTGNNNANITSVPVSNET